MKTIAILDSDIHHAAFLKEALSRHVTQVKIDTFTEGSVAALRFDEELPHVIITDLSLADGDAFSLIRKAGNDLRGCAFFVLSGFPALQDIAATFSSLTNVTFFSKPCDLDTLLDSIHSVLLKTPDSLLRGIKVHTVVQMVQMDHKDCFLEVVAPGAVGYLCFQQGNLYHASTEDLTGEPAFAEILRRPVEVIRVFEGYYEAERNINAPLLKLLLTHCKSEDERYPVEEKAVQYQ